MVFLSSPSIVLSIVNFITLYSKNYQVECRPKEVIPVPGWFNNVEGFILPNIKGYESTEPSYINKHVDNEDFFNTLRRKNTKRKRKRTAKKLLEDERRKKPDGTKRNRKPRGHRLRFIKSDAKAVVKDSKLSESKEKHADRNPVDIIVHIKMNE